MSYDPAKPYITILEWPGGRKVGTEFATEREALAKARELQRLHGSPGWRVYVVYTAQPRRVIHSWQAPELAV